MKLRLLGSVLLISLFVVGCAPQEEPPQLEFNDPRVDGLITEVESLKVDIAIIKNKQLTASDILDLTKLQQYTTQQNNIPINIDGCPSYDDVEKWTDKFSNGDISQSQLDKIIEDYNDCQ